MSLSDIGKSVCDHLASASIDKEVEEIEKLLKIIDEGRGREEINLAIDSLLSRCHPRWLGDYYIEDITYQDWTHLISKFHRSLNKLKRKLNRNYGVV
ncbi:hypothetical protein EXT68_19655 [Pectobacterium parmentieri]|uniref:Uncharacterized protein n=1 Tax=Pectobacterium parmentieri TaxID=1905730 RepID=A0A0H3I384_PECPM|nr:hypothetical protein [Pectobacterium parmentieri]AFI89107.1 Hypothetical protein W5S_0989 [Pectobacterium parmentieri]MBI0470210.1 hypothetical protein [Pectobacterium parmentieri]MBI0492810.1 hypothetical protein [Pectobacterium parmentieri]MBI0553673.1 hypothetical protein [Pectobacterium parmentieri]MBI0567087.1 hypothetical protein [Pectobacterium parmentieri]